MRMLLDANTPAVAIFGKSWKQHIERALRLTEQQNLEMIHSTIAHLKALGREVIYDAEHFFDGYAANRDFALGTLAAAQRAGADCLVLCDTNGGAVTGHLAEIVADVRKNFDGVIGIVTVRGSRGAGRLAEEQRAPVGLPAPPWDSRTDATGNTASRPRCPEAVNHHRCR